MKIHHLVRNHLLRHYPLRDQRIRRQLHPRPRVRRVTNDDDSGQILLLVLIYVMVTVCLVLVIISVTSVHIGRQRLQHIADAAALDAADAMNHPRYYNHQLRTGKTELQLTTPGVIAAAKDYVAAAPGREDFTAIQVLDTSHTTQGRSATVVLAGTIDLPLLAFLNIGKDMRFEVSSTAAAKAA